MPSHRPVLALVLALLASSAFLGTTVERLSLDDLTFKAHTIVRGRVLDVTSRWDNERRFILTETRVDVGEVWKGSAARVISLTTIGGRVGDTILQVSGMPAFASGEEIVVFLEKKRELNIVLGLSQGKLRVQGDEVRGSVDGLEFLDGRTGGPVRMSVKELRTRVRYRLGGPR